MISEQDRAAIDALLATAPTVPAQNAENIDVAIGHAIQAAYARLAAASRP